VDEEGQRLKQIAEIEATFEAAKVVPQHPNPEKRHLTPVAVLPVLPDFKKWPDKFVNVQFESNPGRGRAGLQGWALVAWWWRCALCHGLCHVIESRCSAACKFATRLIAASRPCIPGDGTVSRCCLHVYVWMPCTLLKCGHTCWPWHPRC
jgi:hypothetical protein